MRKRRAVLLGVSCVAAYVIVHSRDKIIDFISDFRNRSVVPGVVVHISPRPYMISGEELIPVDGMGEQTFDDDTVFIYVRYMKDGKSCLAQADRKYDKTLLHPGVCVFVRPNKKNIKFVHIT